MPRSEAEESNAQNNKHGVNRNNNNNNNTRDQNDWVFKHAARRNETGIRAWRATARTRRSSRQTWFCHASVLYRDVTFVRFVLGSVVVPTVRGVFYMRVHLLRVV